MTDRLSLMIESLTALHTHSPKVQLCERIELKRMGCGSFRLYIPTPPGWTKADVSHATAVLANLPVTVNPFAAGGQLKALTICDDREGTSDQPES